MFYNTNIFKFQIPLKKFTPLTKSTDKSMIPPVLFNERESKQQVETFKDNGQRMAAQEIIAKTTERCWTKLEIII